MTNIIDRLENWLTASPLSFDAQVAVGVRMDSLRENLREAGIEEVDGPELACQVQHYIDMGGDFDEYIDEINTAIQSVKGE